MQVKSSVKQFFRHSFRCCVCKETQRRGSTITLTKSNVSALNTTTYQVYSNMLCPLQSVTLATTNTNCPGDYYYYYYYVVVVVVVVHYLWRECYNFFHIQT